MFTEEQIPELLAQLTLEEKCSLLSGSDFWHTQPVERLGIPALMVSDGPHGLRKQAVGADEMGLEESVPATCFPTAAALASTWDVTLLTEIGRALAEEAKAQGVGVILGPGVNLKRSPLCGRNFEYFSEDPLLAGELAAALAAGIQSGGVGTSVKHFAANNQETDRMRTNARIDERTLREIYLSIFERIIERARPATLMCSYNRINDVYSSENRWLLTEVLREEWGFDGLVMTDWGAVHDRVAGVAAGLDLEMPSSHGWNDRLVAEAVRTGALDESDLDRSVARVLRLVSRHHRETPEEHLDLGAHHELAREAASRSAVLLKNERAALPLPGLGDVVVIGEMARTPRYQGAGSSQVNPTRLDNALDALRRRHPGLPFEPGYPLPDSPAAAFPAGELLRRAQEAAAGRTVLLFLGLPAADESEGYDRQHISLPAGHVDLLRAVRRVANGVIVLLSNGAAVETASWQDDADAIMELWLPGQGGGEAVARLVTGEDSPAAGWRKPFLRGWSSTPHNSISRVKQVRCVTGKGFSSDTAGSRNSGTDRVTPSDTVWPTPPSSSAICGLRWLRSPPKRRWARWFSPLRSPSPTPEAEAVSQSPSSISGIRSPRWAALPGNYEVSGIWNWGRRKAPTLRSR
ncbi:glycoside hydrolase family 3 protein [Arachnia propionica]|jgi:glycoside hydrolase family 3 domain protein|uniref:Glycoside hydrolase family 3 protein n=1 Tax=Arachnia propionica TaxID=1750 RepID=A0AB37HPZ1_9ACTN|nr:glycoside hydrolase family 3 protein [Arachnia propionica]QUC09789.1 glycoside hydrolase family 3 protein [Arachnia propionica]QUC15533.1 glycoside hydrolase family 3 protein [Arachnia propionica]